MLYCLAMAKTESPGSTVYVRTSEREFCKMFVLSVNLRSMADCWAGERLAVAEVGSTCRPGEAARAAVATFSGAAGNAWMRKKAKPSMAVTSAAVIPQLAILNQREAVIFSIRDPEDLSGLPKTRNMIAKSLVDQTKSSTLQKDLTGLTMGREDDLRRAGH